MDGASLDKLRKIAGMLGSEHAGERAAAALKATALLKAAGMSWGQIDLAKGASRSSLFEAESRQALVWEAHRLQILLTHEQARAARMAEEIIRLQREVYRLRGMWRNGEPSKPIDAKITREAAEEATSAAFDNRALRRKVAAAVEACAAGRLHISGEHLQMFRFLMMKSKWSRGEKTAIKSALIAIYSEAGDGP